MAAFREEVRAQLDAVRAESEGRPVFLFGHSMGGLLVAQLLEDGVAGLAGAVLSSPLLALPETVSPVLVRLANVLGTVTPWLPVERLDSTAISRVAAVVAAYDADPLVYRGPIHARTGAEFTRAINTVVAGFGRIRDPFLVVHGTADRLAPVAGSRQLLDQASSPDKTGNFYDGGYHELLNDEARELVSTDIIDWLLARCS